MIEESGEWEAGLVAELGFQVAGRRLARRGEVHVGEPHQLGAGLAIPLSWKALSKNWFLPDVQADLMVAPLGPRRTQLEIAASYTPPFAKLGEVLDQALMHRVAEAVIRDFGERVVSVLEARIRDSSGRPS